MTKHNSDFSARGKYYSEYYQLNSFPETMFLIEAECLETPGDKIQKSQSSVKGVMCALSILVTLIVGTTWQLYRSLKVTPVNSQTVSSQKSSSILLSEQTLNQLPKRQND